MSFGTSAGDAILLVQLAWKTLQGARQACGEHDELTREVASLHRVLLRLQRENEDPESLLTQADHDRRQELGELCSGCEQVLKVMDSIISKYNALSEDKRSGKRLWQKVQFGNGEMQDLAEIRLKLSAHTSAILLSLNLCSLSCQGRIERRMNNVGGDLEGIRWKVDWIAANMAASSGEGSIWSSYTDDDRGFWRELRRGLVKEGYRSSVLHRHKHLIKQYVEELGNRGVFDEGNDTNSHAVEDEEHNRQPSESSDSEDAEEDETLDVVSSDEQQSHEEQGGGKLARESTPESTPANTNFDSRSKVDDEDVNGPKITQPEDERVIDSPLTPPQTPKTSKYLRFDKRIHVGSINPGAMKARSPEEQAAHDKRKEKRRRRTPEEREAHDKRKAERRSETSKHKRVVIHPANRSSPEGKISTNLLSEKYVQMEEIPDESFSSELHQNQNIQKDGEISLKKSAGIPSHSTTSSQSSISEMSSSETLPGLIEHVARGSSNSRLSSQKPPKTSWVESSWDRSIEETEAAIPSRGTRSNPAPKLTLPSCEVITFKDAKGRKYTFPLQKVKTWDGMKSAINRIFLMYPEWQSQIAFQRYDLIAPQGQVVLPQHWEDLIKPNWNILMKLWPFPPGISMTPIATPIPAHLMFDPPETDDDVPSNDNSETQDQFVYLKDSVGRDYIFPFLKVKTWKGIRTLITQIFMHVEFIDAAFIEQGCYDLIGPLGTIIIPEFWQELMQPEWTFTMMLWSCVQTSLTADQPNQKPLGAISGRAPPPPPPAVGLWSGGARPPPAAYSLDTSSRPGYVGRDVKHTRSDSGQGQEPVKKPMSSFGFWAPSRHKPKRGSKKS